MDRALPSSLRSTARDGTSKRAALKRRPWSEKEQAAVKRFLSDFIIRMKVPGKKECNACIAAEPDLSERSWTDVKNYVHNTLQTIRRRNNQQKCEGNVNALDSKSQDAGVQTTTTNLEDTKVVCTMTAVDPEHLTESQNYYMTVTTTLGDLSPFSQEISSYASLCSSSTNMVHASQPLISSFTALNATDTQVVPTFTPHNTTSAPMPPPYTSENNRIFPMSPLYAHNSTNMPPPSVYAPQDTTTSPMIPSYTTLSAPSTSMIPTYGQLNPPNTPLMPTYSTLTDRNRPIISSFTPLNHSCPQPYPLSPPSRPTAAQVVPTIHGSCVPDRGPVVQESTPMPSAGTKVTPPVKPQKRNKRLWSDEEQAAVRRQLGDFCKLVKVPGKKDCDACLAAEPALSSRTWREVKYFVHNSIQSLKRRGHVVACKQNEVQQPNINNQNSEWDGPVYLSL
ncbi:uncharacterized protein KZ484_016572 [Pholidichthys leucotaenia]